MISFIIRIDLELCRKKASKQTCQQKITMKIEENFVNHNYKKDQ